MIVDYAYSFYVHVCIATECTAIQSDAMVIQRTAMLCHAISKHIKPCEYMLKKRHPNISQHISCIPMCLFPSSYEFFSLASTFYLCLEFFFKACPTMVCQHWSDLRCLQRKPFHCTPLHLQKPFGQRNDRETNKIHKHQKSIKIKSCSKTLWRRTGLVVVVGNLRLKFEVKVHEIKGLNGGFQLLNLMSSQECEVTWVQLV